VVSRNESHSSSFVFAINHLRQGNNAERRITHAVIVVPLTFRFGLCGYIREGIYETFFRLHFRLVGHAGDIIGNFIESRPDRFWDNFEELPLKFERILTSDMQLILPLAS
jgi:hypothetical protein